MSSRTLLILVLAATAARCAGPPRSERSAHGDHSGTAVVQFNAEVNSDAREKYRRDADADYVATLPRSNGELWRIDPGNTQALTQLRQDATVSFVEVSQSTAATALASGSIEVQQLSNGDQSMVRRLTEGMSAADFRVTASRPISINADILDVGSQERIAVPLLATLSPVFARERMDREPTGAFTWIGNAVDGQGDAILVIRPQGITGRVRVGNDAYSVLPLSDGRQLIRREQPSQFPPDHPPAPAASVPPPPENLDAAATSCQPVDPAIDVLVVYSDEAGKELKDPAGLAKLAVEQANRSYRDSKVTSQLRLVDTRAADYTESGSMTTDVKAMSKGSITKVKEGRKQTAADIVIMLLANRDYCGEAAEILAKSSTAFAVVSHSCAVGNVSFAHEIGHLFGARHDREADNDDTPGFKYAHGYTLKNEWRTVMAYPGSCHCTRREFWADSGIKQPDSKGQPQPTGVKDDAEDARILRARFTTLAQFQCRASITH